jgi:hypothetical protein
LKSRAVSDRLEEAGDSLFTFTRFPPGQWKSIRTSDEIDKQFLRQRATDGERRRGEGRRLGCERRKRPIHSLPD